MRDVKEFMGLKNGKLQKYRNRRIEVDDDNMLMMAGVKEFTF